MPYTNILAPTDFSEPANHALALAFEQAELHHARVTLLYVLHNEPVTEVFYTQASPAEPRDLAVEYGAALPMGPRTEPQAIRRDHVEEALTRLRDLVPESFTGKIEEEVVSGDPADEIVRVAKERDADLIVIGTHGRTGLRHMVLGSVAEKVVRQAPCPVLTTRQSP